MSALAIEIFHIWVYTVACAGMISLFVVLFPAMLEDYKAARVGAKAMLLTITWPVTFPLLVVLAIKATKKAFAPQN